MLAVSLFLTGMGGIGYGDKSGVWLHQLASLVMNSKEEAELM